MSSLMAEEAQLVRLINQMVPDEDVLASTEAITAKTIRYPLSAVRLAMEAPQIGVTVDRFDAIHHRQHLCRPHRLHYGGYASTEGFLAGRRQ